MAASILYTKAGGKKDGGGRRSERCGGDGTDEGEKRKVRKRLSPFFSFAFSSETEDDSVKPAGSKHICIISQIPTCWNLIENMLYESVTNLKVIMDHGPSGLFVI